MKIIIVEESTQRTTTSSDGLLCPKLSTKSILGPKNIQFRTECLGQEVDIFFFE